VKTLDASVRSWLAGVVLVLAGACGGDSTGPTSTPSATPSPRSFALGFTDFPHARTVEAVNAALAVIRRDADLILLHFDDGVPWEEALAGTPYPASLEADLSRRAVSTPPGHVRYLAVTPIAFDDPMVVDAFTAHCERMIATFDPDYFAYGIEANMLEFLAPEKWPAFVRLASAVYSSLKASHPSLPIFLTFQVDFLHAAPSTQTAAIQQVLPSTDVLAASSYPYANDPDPGALRANHFGALADMAPGKPFAVAETAWPGEDVTAPYPVVIPSSEEDQQAYVERLLSDADRLSALFVCWFFTRDYDDFWEAELRHSPDANLIRLWKDTGLYRGDGTPRPALESWRARLARPRR
jgi:hypothetical protein